jgi:hypothetical protein
MRILASLCLVVAACDGGSQALLPGTTPDDPAIVTRTCLGPTDPFSLEQAMSLEADILKVSVSYGGGCEEHTFIACWDGSTTMTQPSTLTLALHHDAHGDKCDAFVTRDLFIDVSTLPDNFGSPSRASQTSVLMTQLLKR